MAGALQLLDRRVSRAHPARRQTASGRRRDRCRRRPARPALHLRSGMMPLPCFAERFGDELLEPGAEARERRRRDQRRLVAPCQRQLAEHHAELERRSCPDRADAQRRAMSRARSSSMTRIGAQQRGRHQPEIRQRRIPAADARQCPGKSRGSLPAAQSAASFEPGIGRQDEVAAGLSLAELLHRAVKKVLLEDVDFERRSPTSTPRGTSSGENRSRARPRESAPGSVESSTCSAGYPSARADDRPHHFRREARAAHAEQHDVRRCPLP